MSNLEQLFIMLSAVAGSTALWKYFETRLKTRAEQRKLAMENSDGSLYREDLKMRVERLQADLEEATESIIQLTKKVAELETENKYLKKEIEDLKSK